MPVDKMPLIAKAINPRVAREVASRLIDKNIGFVMQPLNDTYQGFTILCADGEYLKREIHAAEVNDAKWRHDIADILERMGGWPKG